ncbi:hypothetical protein SESBI_06657 [Sesbania bispinosa]|nr:hypothetical protein SESBI_06657 [Sesbania bispinosa]
MEEERVTLSQEETDNLLRSTKKQKHVVTTKSSGDTFVKETPPTGFQGASSSAPTGNKVLFPTATGQRISRGAISYKDICLGSSLRDEDGDGGSDDDSYSSSDYEEDDSDLQAFLAECDPLCPIVKISRKEKKKLSIPWHRAIIVKLLGKRIVWSVDDHGTLSGGLEMVSRIFPLEDDLKRVAVWIRIAGLPVEYYDRQILWRIGDTVGQTLKVDSNTLRERVIGLDNPDKMNVDMSNGGIGDTRPKSDQGNGDQEAASPEEGFGPWMLVQKGGRRTRSGHVGNANNDTLIQSSTVKGDKNGNGSRFAILENDEANQEDQERPNVQINADLMLDDTVKEDTSPNDGAIIKDRREAVHTFKTGKKPLKTVISAFNSRKGNKSSNGTIVSNKLQVDPSMGHDQAAKSMRHYHDHTGINKKEKNKGTMGLHSKSRVSFKGVKEAAHKLAKKGHDTWPFVSNLEDMQPHFNVGPLTISEPISTGLCDRNGLGPEYVSSIKPPDGPTNLIATGSKEQPTLIPFQNVMGPQL